MSGTAVVLASGGLDSTTCMAVAAAAGQSIVALSFDYGQRHRVELEAAARVAEFYGARHLVSRFDLLAKLGHSALTAEIAVPKDREEGAMAAEIPVTYVPARNLVFLAHATAVAEVFGAEHLYIGVNAVDYSGYPDCRPAFVEAFAAAARLATKAGSEGRPLAVQMPLVELSKAEIVALGLRLGAPFELTHSCYDPGAAGVSCGRCDSCRLRLRGFLAAGSVDPIRYAG
jgi:7-cyano-7-deazaguanine synthase